MNELLFMREVENYACYRIYEASDTGGKLKISLNLRQFSQNIISILGQLPTGISSDSISVDPLIMVFEDESKNIQVVY